MKQKPEPTSKVRDVNTAMEYCELYSCLRRLMRFARWFGLIPLEGLDSEEISGLRFNIKSFYGLYLTLSVIGQFIMAVISVWTLLWSQLALIKLTHAILYVGPFVCMVLLIKLAKNWPILMKEIAEIEKEILVMLNKSTSLNIFRLTLFVVFFYAVEHMLCYMYVINFAMKCLQDFSFSYAIMDIIFTLKLEVFLQQHPPDSFNFILGALFEFTNAQAKFILILVDLLVVCHSVYLGAYFKAINKLIESEKDNTSANWSYLRYQHARLVILVKKVDERLCHFVLLSFSANLYFTIVQLFNSLRTPLYEFGTCNYDGVLESVTGALHELFYKFSFAYLIMRIFMVSLVTTSVHTYACQPTTVLGEVHPSKYGTEIQRFCRQITYTTIGVSGIFFYVTREMVLKVLGTLITYELVLLQFTHKTTLYNSTQDYNMTDRQYRRFTFSF